MLTRLARGEYRTSVLVLTLVLASALPAVGQETAPAGPQAPSPPTAESLDLPAELTPETAAAQLEAVRARLAALPPEPAEGTPAAGKRAALERRRALLERFQALEQRAAEIEAEERRLAEIEAEARAALAELERAPAPEAPDDPTQAGFDALEREVAEQRKRVAALQSRIQENARTIADAPERVAEERAAAEEAEARAAELAASAQAAADSARQRLLGIRADNARLARRVAERAVTVHEAAAKLARARAPVLAVERRLAEARLERLETRFEAYSDALQEKLARAQEAKQRAAERKAEQAKAEADPAQRFLAEKEAALARSQAQAGELKAELVRLQKEVQEAETSLAAEKLELAALRDYLERSGGSARAAERVQLMLKRIDLQRRRLAEQSGLAERIEAYRARRIAIEDALFGLSREWDARIAELSAGMGETAAAELARRARELLDRYREALRQEKSLLTDVIAAAQNLQGRRAARAEALAAARARIRAEAFWLRDDEALGIATVRGAAAELAALAARAREGLGPLRERLAGLVRAPGSLALALIGFALLPAGLGYAGHRLASVGARARATEANRWGLLARLLLGAALLPAYLGGLGMAVRRLEWPGGLEQMVGLGLTAVAGPLLLWLVGRGLLRGGGLAAARFGLDPAAAVSLYRALRLALFAWAVLLVPWMVLAGRPLVLEHLPRLLYTGFELVTAVAIALLLRPGSPFVARTLLPGSSGFVARNWRRIAVAVIALLVLVVGLDAAGFRYAAGEIGRGLLLTLAVALALPALHAVIVEAVERVARERRRRQRVAPPGEGEAPEEAPLPERVRGFLRVVLGLVAILLLAEIWGIDERALAALDAWQLYPLEAAAEGAAVVSAYDALRFLAYLAATVWLVRHLSGIFELLVFPRLRLDAGARYAVLTIARYAVAAVGILLAFAAIELDLSSLGWLVAALGVGLGFGLQEIVSNFVSGIILLVERPIQVDDVITVGGTSGTVTKINIRATTLMNFDNREVLLPNRSLITSEVTNWTRGSSVNRLVVSVGVAYGSDVQRVSEILESVAREQPEVLADPAPSVIFMEHGESSLNFALRVFLPSPNELMPLTDRLNKRINQALAEAGVEIPFPQRDLHIRSGPETVARPAEASG